MNKSQIHSIIESHNKWLSGNGGERADLSSYDLRESDFRGAILRGANFNSADLRGADMRDSDLQLANMSCANLEGAIFDGANLGGAVGNNGRMSCLQHGGYRITILDKKICWAACTKMTCDEWLNYPGNDLGDYDRKYLENITKPFIRMVMGFH